MMSLAFVVRERAHALPQPRSLYVVRELLLGGEPFPLLADSQRVRRRGAVLRSGRVPTPSSVRILRPLVLPALGGSVGRVAVNEFFIVLNDVLELLLQLSRRERFG